MCKVDGCERVSAYKKDDVCQKHYFRFMRNGTYETVRKRKYRVTNQAGYQSLLEPNHPLSQSSGYVYEHRMVAYSKYGETLPDCELCGKACSWDIYTTHIDHIDEDVTNNNPLNLRPLCNGCNSSRNNPPKHTWSNATAITFNGKTMTANEWSREDGVLVSRPTIINRLAKGYSVEDALFSRKKTHNGKRLEKLNSK